MLDLTFAGRVGRDAETRTTQAGESVTSFTVAVDTGWGDRKATQWIDCTIWRDRGVKLAPYIKKGQNVTVRGRPSVRTYTNQSGEPKAILQCTVDEIALQGGKRDDSDRGGSTQGGGYDAGPDLDGDEIPW